MSVGADHVALLEHRLAAATTRADEAEALLRNLNARLHRDGGQHADVLGSLEACTLDSDRLAAELISANGQYEADCAALREALEGACKIINNPGAPLAYVGHYGPKINAALATDSGKRLLEKHAQAISNIRFTWNAEIQTLLSTQRAETAARDQRLLSLEVRLHALARAAKHLALATPDKVLRSELEHAVKLADEVLPKESTA